MSVALLGRRPRTSGTCTRGVAVVVGFSVVGGPVVGDVVGDPLLLGASVVGDSGGSVLIGGSVVAGTSGTWTARTTTKATTTASRMVARVNSTARPRRGRLAGGAAVSEPYRNERVGVADARSRTVVRSPRPAAPIARVASWDARGMAAVTGSPSRTRSRSRCISAAVW